MRTRSSVVAAGLLGVVLLGAGSWAWAAIPAPATGLITACYAKVGGALRVIDGATAAKCRATENKISWQQAGLRWRGVWSATVPYALNDAVSYRGGSAIATANPPVGTQPSLEAYWAKLAVPGAAAPTP